MTNLGDVALSSVTVTDSRLGAISLDATNLAPGASASGSASYLVQESDEGVILVNTATANGTFPAGTVVQGVDHVTVIIVAPEVFFGKFYLPIMLKD